MTTAPVKLLRTIRLDRSDTFVFARAAEAGEWASPGSFMFWGGDPSGLEGKARAAFRSGFLGLGSYGWSTLAEVATATPEQVEGLKCRLAQYLVNEHGAPDLAAAQTAAEDEIAFSASLADHPLGTVIALARTIESDGSVRERFRTIRTTLEPGQNTFAQGCVQPIGFERDAGADGERIEEVDLVGLMNSGATDAAGKALK